MIAMMTRFSAKSETETFARIEYMLHSRIAKSILASRGRKTCTAQGCTLMMTKDRGRPALAKRRSSIEVYMHTDEIMYFAGFRFRIFLIFVLGGFQELVSSKESVMDAKNGGRTCEENCNVEIV